MKKVINIILGIISFLAIFIIAITIYISVHISDTSYKVHEESISDSSVDELLNKYLEESLENTYETKKVDFCLSELELNYILHSFSKDFDFGFFKLNDLHATYNSDGTILFEAPGTALFINSCLRLNCDLEIKDEGFNLVINDAYLGSLDLCNSIVYKIINKNIDIDGLTINYSKGIYQVLITKECILDMSLQSDDYLAIAIVNELLSNNSFLEYKFNDNNETGINLNLVDVCNSYELDYEINDIIDEAKSMFNTLISNNIVNNDNSDLLFSFIIQGYDALGYEDQSLIKLYDLSSISISNCQDYKGLITRYNLTIKDIFDSFNVTNVSNWANLLLKQYYDIKITNDELNKILHNQDIIGQSFVLLNGDKYSYVTINSLECEILNDKLNIYLIISVNGLNLSLRIDLDYIENKNGSLKLSIDDILLGNMSVDSKTKVYLIRYLSENVELDFMKFDYKNMIIQFDFSKYLSDSFFSYLIREKFNNIEIILTEEENKEIIIRLKK